MIVMNNKGQALVEFVLILPIFLLLLLAVYDFGRIFNTKNILLSDSNDIVEMVKNEKTIDDVKNIYDDIDIKISDEEEYRVIEVSDKIELMTPGFNKIFGEPYIVMVKRYIPNE